MIHYSPLFTKLTSTPVYLISGVFVLIREDNIRITITMPKKLYKLIQDEAGYEDRSMSNVIVRILKKYYKFKVEDE